MRAFEHPVTRQTAETTDMNHRTAFASFTSDQGDDIDIGKNREPGRRRREKAKKHVRFDPRDRDDWN